MLGASGNEGEHDGSLWHGAAANELDYDYFSLPCNAFCDIGDLLDKLSSKSDRRI